MFYRGNDKNGNDKCNSKLQGNERIFEKKHLKKTFDILYIDFD